MPKRTSRGFLAPSPCALLCTQTLVAALTCCAAQHAPSALPLAGDPHVARGPALAFDIECLDRTRITSEASVGRNTVIGFLVTYDLASQAQARFLREIAREHVPRTNTYAIIVEAAESHPLAVAFADALGLRFPVALVDARTLARTAFKDERSVPSVLILDRQGRVAWRKNGIVESKEIHAALRSFE